MTPSGSFGTCRLHFPSQAPRHRLLYIHQKRQTHLTRTCLPRPLSHKSNRRIKTRRTLPHRRLRVQPHIRRISISELLPPHVPLRHWHPARVQRQAYPSPSRHLELGRKRLTIGPQEAGILLRRKPCCPHQHCQRRPLPTPRFPVRSFRRTACRNMRCALRPVLRRTSSPGQVQREEEQRIPDRVSVRPNILSSSNSFAETRRLRRHRHRHLSLNHRT